jgi:hypothetical protein
VARAKSKVFFNYARFLEAPIPVSVNLFAGAGVAVSSDALVNRLNAPEGSMVTVDFGSCCGVTPVDSDLKPQTVNEVTAGIEETVAN